MKIQEQTLFLFRGAFSTRRQSSVRVENLSESELPGLAARSAISPKKIFRAVGAAA
jgi:hypothetical protein